jgi:transcriptional regulator with XRE-family HTH domain
MEQTMGDRIRFLRKAKGLTQEQLAQQLGVSLAAVSHWEIGNTKNIKNQTFLALCKIFDTSQEFLVNGPDPGPVSDEPTGQTGKFRKPRF